MLTVLSSKTKAEKIIDPTGEYRQIRRERIPTALNLSMQPTNPGLKNKRENQFIVIFFRS